MAKNKELTWFTARKIWKKKHKGRVYYLSRSGECTEHDRIGYEKALLKWLQLKSLLDQQDALMRPKPEARPTVEMASHWGHLPERVPIATEAPSASTLAEVVEVYLTERRQQAESGERAVSTYREAKDKLEDFQGFAKKYKKKKLAEIDAQFLKYYRDETKRLPPLRNADGTAGRKISPFTAKKRLAAVRQFMEWAYRNEYLERLPRNIDRKYVEIDLPDPTPTVFTLAEARKLFAACSQRTKLYFLLALNCGYGQTDIATLQHAHIFWEEGVIHRTRNKTGSPQHHKLWKITQKLLKREMTDPRDCDLALLDENGRPLMVESLDATTAKTDPIGRGFDRARRKLTGKCKGMGIKYLRKTGAQTLENNYPATPHIVKQYLGHKEKDVAKHYRTESYSLLFDALDWMETYFGLKA